MVTKAKSITAADLTKLTRAAVKASTKGVAGTFIGTGQTMGYILREDLAAGKQLEIAVQIATGVADSAKAAGISGIRPKPLVVLRPGKIIAGFWPAELDIPIR
jgi:hypothetical protein